MKMRFPNVTGVEIAVGIVILFVMFLLADCTAGYCLGRYQTVYGTVVDKEHDIRTDDDGHRTHYYTLTVDIVDGKTVEADASETLYDNVSIGDFCEIHKRVGYSGICYGYGAVAKHPKPTGAEK